MMQHFDGTRFFYPHYRHTKTFKDFLKWQRTRQKGSWPTWVTLDTFDQPPAHIDDEVRISFVGHSTVLLQVNGLNILTDPVWSKHIGPVSWAGPKRVHAPGIHFNDLPTIDLVLLSHTHYDHLDRPTMKRLRKKHNPQIIAGLGVDKVLNRFGLTATTLNWYDNITIKGTKITFVPAHHWTNRTPWDRNKSLWGGFIIHTSQGQIYYAGDTAFESTFYALQHPLFYSLLAKQSSVRQIFGSTT